MKKWVLYTFTLGFAAYWASNLLLWFPWSYSAELGITLMLTIMPILWFYLTFLSIKTYPKQELMKGALTIALIFLLLAVVMDYIFFGLIRNAMEELYHPTTFYGYAFLLVWPFILVWVLKKKILRLRKKVTHSAIMKASICGIFCLAALSLIIAMGIEL